MVWALTAWSLREGRLGAMKFIYNTYQIILANIYKNIPTDTRLTLNVFACICGHLVGIKEVFGRYSEVFDQYFAVL